MKIRFKYPKIAAFILVIIMAYIIFKNLKVGDFLSNLGGLSSFGIFIAGTLYSFGFTSPFSAGFFLTLNTEHILIAGILGGLGAMFSDLFIFKFVRFSFKNELMLLKEEKIIKKIRKIINKLIHKKVRSVLLVIIAGILIASPLPDETGVIILAGLTKIKEKFMAVIGFTLNTIGIIILLKIGATI